MAPVESLVCRELFLYFLMDPVSSSLSPDSTVPISANLWQHVRILRLELMREIVHDFGICVCIREAINFTPPFTTHSSVCSIVSRAILEDFLSLEKKLGCIRNLILTALSK